VISLPDPHRACLSGGNSRRLLATKYGAARIAHIAVVTHPSHRGRGYGKAAVAHLAARAIAEGLLPQYRTLDSNQPSLRIAEALGFQRYATSVAVRLKN
jgi:predicted GNAT family acetyltransferase